MTKAELVLQLVDMILSGGDEDLDFELDGDEEGEEEEGDEEESDEEGDEEGEEEDDSEYPSTSQTRYTKTDDEPSVIPSDKNKQYDGW